MVIHCFEGSRQEYQDCAQSRRSDKAETDRGSDLSLAFTAAQSLLPQFHARRSAETLQALQQQAISVTTKIYRICYASYYNHLFEPMIVREDCILLEQVVQILGRQEVDQSNFELQHQACEQLQQDMCHIDGAQQHHFIAEILQQLSLQYQTAIALLQYEKKASLQS